MGCNRAVEEPSGSRMLADRSRDHCGYHRESHRSTRFGTWKADQCGREDGRMTLLVKICGLSTPDALDVALEAGADMVGFVFFAPSPRHLGLGTARTLGERVRGRARKVALTVDASDDALARVVEALAPD